METILLIVTVISLVVALVMSVTAWRLARDEKRRSAARVAALSITAADNAPIPLARAPWAPAAREVSHSSGFLSATTTQRQDTGGGQRVLAIAAAVLCIGLLGGLVWMMAGPRGTSAAAVGPNRPLELVSLRHERLKEKLAVSGLVRNPAAAKPVERLSAVVFLFDRLGGFVTSAKADVDFLKLGAGDESPFVVSLDAPATVARYRVSFRTDDGVVPHIDRRGATPLAAEGGQPVSVTLK
ncbi:MAG: hypothetical protein EXQ50_04605 [Acidobacteria bacterium]|nr:hypothetical protein [Acidobacteriota bacterium]MSO61361.1 hypothetical protein [Acidobacteriota bacterium]